MAEIQDSGGGGRRPKSFEPNLVPFIDLMSVLITFLLITAVWTQVSMIQIGTSIYGKKDERAQQKPIPPKNVEIPLRLDIFREGYLLVVGGEQIRLPLVGGAYDDAGLLARLERVKQLYPEKEDGAISMQDDLPYERLIKGMDAFLAAGFSQIAVLTGGPK